MNTLNLATCPAIRAVTMRDLIQTYMSCATTFTKASQAKRDGAWIGIDRFTGDGAVMFVALSPDRAAERVRVRLSQRMIESMWDRPHAWNRPRG